MRLKKWGVAAIKAAWRRTAAINLIVTRRCDLACTYCHALRKGKEIAPGDWIEIARRLSHRYSAFTVSGGEPLLYKGLPEVIAGISKIGIAGLCTNARMITEDHLQALEGLDYLNFSIDYAGEHAPGDQASRKNAFGKMPLLMEYSRRHNFELFGTAVITHRSLHAIPEVVREMARHKIPLNLQLVQRPHAEDAFDTPEKLAELASLQMELLSMKHAGYAIDESDTYIADFAEFIEGRTAVNCHAGEVYLAVDTDGRLMPCQDTAPVGLPVLEIDDIDAALQALPGSIPGGCRCWWNCYHRYQDWQRNPWLYIAQAEIGSIRRPARVLG